MMSRHFLQSSMIVTPGFRKWGLLAALVAIWGSGYMFVKIGVATVAPATLVALRVVIGAAVLYAILCWRGGALPRSGNRWLSLTVLALLGNCMPFYLISWGQQYIDSALAAILIAAMPLATLVLAHVFVAGERMSVSRAAGFSAGFLGIVVLMGPAALAGFGGSLREIFAQVSVLGGALCYAANSVFARRAVLDDFLATSTAVLLVASVISVPLALLIDQPWESTPSLKSLAAIAWLGVGPTAVATLVYFKLIAVAGPTFMSIVNYLSPVVAVAAGVLLLGEHPGPAAVTGLALIMMGIALSRWR